MMVEKDEELGLSLSLSFPSENNGGSMHHRVLPSPLRSRSWTEAAFTSSDRRDEACTRKGIDVNCLPETAEAAVSSPNSTVSTDEEDADNARKKLRLSKDQSAVLEDSFKEHNTLNPKQKMGLAKRLGLRPRQVEVWFQNRRARTKLKQTEVDCEFLKRCCDNLTEENRRLQKEVQELRVLKLSPQLYMQMTPPTTLTMCPSCERVALPSPSPFAPSSAARPCPRPIPFNHNYNHWPPALDALPSTS